MDASQDRREFKFLLQPGLLDKLRAAVAEHLEPDGGREDGYRILSEYFDSDTRDSHWDKVFGFPNRRRIRTRCYGDPSQDAPLTRFIEIKHKKQGLTVKRRVLTDDDEFEEFVEERAVPDVPEDQECRVQAELSRLMEDPPKIPVVRIQYHRYAYDSGPTGTIRITFDVDVRCAFFSDPNLDRSVEPHLPLIEEGQAIMEVKTIDSVPYWFRDILGRFKLVPTGFSKYSTALAKYEFQKESQMS